MSPPVRGNTRRCNQRGHPAPRNGGNNPSADLPSKAPGSLVRTGALIYLTDHARRARNHPDRLGTGHDAPPPRSSWNSHQPQPSGCKPTSAHAQNDKAKALLSLRKYSATRLRNQPERYLQEKSVPRNFPRKMSPSAWTRMGSPSECRHP